MQPSDLARVVSVSDPAVAPDGSTVAVVVGQVDVDANRGVSSIWLVPVDGEEAVPFARGPDDATRCADGQAQWSPSGDRLAFTRVEAVDGARTVRLLVARVDTHLTGAVAGEPIVVATSPELVTSLCWSPDGERLAWCARVPEVDPSVADRDRPPRRITTLFSRLDDEGWTIDRRTQVHVAPADGSAPARPVTAGPFEHTAVAWSPTGDELVVVAARHPGWDLDEVVDLWLVDPDGDPAAGDLDDDPVRLTDGTRAWRRPSWSPDGATIAAIGGDPSLGWVNRRPLAVHLASGQVTDLAPGLDRTFDPSPGARAPVWSADSRSVLVSHEDRGRVTLVRLHVDGSEAPEVVLGGERWVLGFDHVEGPHGAVVAAVVTDSTHPAELEVAVAGEPSGVRTTFTAEMLAAVPPLPVHRFAVPSPSGDGDVDAWLVAPAGFDPDAAGQARSWPVLLSIHGGPMTQFGERWFDEFQLLAGAGFVVVAANPHGSSGRTNAWQRALRSPVASAEPGGGWGGPDAADLVAVLDAALARWPALDPDRVGVLGGSYGGFMTTWLLGTTDRFAAGCSERSVNNMLSEEWSSDIGGSFHRELGVSHLDEQEEYLRMSPVTYVRGIDVPILILHSEDDLRCHIEQADALFVALRLLGRTDVEYWRFPGEGHELSRSGSPSHRIRRAELITEFFARTLSP